jgi:hypothetical protein
MLSDGTVLIAGGFGNAGALSSFEIFDPALPLVTGTGSLTAARAQHTATLLANGTVLVAGGFGTTSALSSAEIYDPATGQWTAIGNLVAARTEHSATLLLNGKVLFAGGSSAGTILASTELNTFSNTIQATLQWNSTGDPSVLGYRVYFGTSSHAYQQAIDAGLNTAYSFANLTSGATYYFSVTAYTLLGESCGSDEVTITIP